MSLFGLFSGDKNSTTSTQTTNQYDDNRQVNDAGGGILGVGSTIDNSTSTSSTFHTSDSGNTTSTLNTSNSGNTSTVLNALDNGAIGYAFDFGKKALGFGTDALGFADNSFARSVGFASDSMKKAFDTGNSVLSQAFNSNQDTVSDALSFANQAQARSYSQVSDALGGVASALDKAFSFGAKQSQTAVDSVNMSARLLDTAYADAKGRGAMTDYLLLAAIGGVALIAFFALQKGH